MKSDREIVEMGSCRLNAWPPVHCFGPTPAVKSQGNGDRCVKRLALKSVYFLVDHSAVSGTVSYAIGVACGLFAIDPLW